MACTSLFVSVVSVNGFELSPAKLVTLKIAVGIAPEGAFHGPPLVGSLG